MARRTVTATFAGGMISDEPKPGTARYLENFIPRTDGVIKVGNGRRFNRSVTGISGSTFTTATQVHGWSGGGTVHPTIGFVGFLDVANSGAAATSQADWLHKAQNLGMGVRSSAEAYRALVRINDTATTTAGVGSFTFADHSGFVPLRQANIVTSTAMTNAMMSTHLNGRQDFTNVEREILISGPSALSPALDSGRVYRYAGSNISANVTTATSTSDQSASAFTSASGWFAPATASAWVDEAFIFGEVANNVTATGCYLGVLIGTGMDASLGNAHNTNSMREFLVTRVDEKSGSGTAAYRKVQIDRKVYFASANRYARCIAGNTAQLTPSQLDSASATQPFDRSPIFALGSENPRAIHGACYHQGRYFVLNDNELAWSGTVDETLQLTSTGNFSTASAATAHPAASALTFGIEYKHYSLWSSNGYLGTLPHIGGTCVGIVPVGDELLIMKEGALLRLVGSVSYDGASNAADLQIISDSIGPDSRHSWCKTQAGIVFTQGSRIWLYDGNEVQDISAGSVSQIFTDDICSHRQDNAGLAMERVVTRVCSDGERVFFTPMRYSLSTSTSGYEPAADVHLHAGNSIHSRHLVLSLRDRKWFFFSNATYSVPSAILPIKSDRGSTYSTYWLDSTKSIGGYATASMHHVVLADSSRVFQEAGVWASGLQEVPSGWQASDASPYSASIVSHPLISGVDTVRPLAALVKRTVASTDDSYSPSASTSLRQKKVRVIDAECSFVPTSTYFTGDDIPQWWSTLTTASTGSFMAAQSPDEDWSIRRNRNVDGSTSTSRAVSQLDRFPLSELESTMTSPTIYFEDNGFYEDLDDGNFYRQSPIIHELGVEIDVVENRTDR